MLVKMIRNWRLILCSPVYILILIAGYSIVALSKIFKYISFFLMWISYMERPAPKWVNRMLKFSEVRK
mgnify:CR=1 FL=1